MKSNVEVGVRNKSTCRVQVMLTPEEVAKLIASMNSDEQTRFVVELGRLVAMWNSYNRDIQLLAALGKIPDGDAKDLIVAASHMIGSGR